MQPQSAQDYKQLLTEVIKKQIVILGPDITLSKARNVKGLVVQNDGTVTDVTGSPQEVTQALIDQFVQLSGLIVKKTMEPLLLGTQQTAAPSPVQAQPASQIANAPMTSVVPQATDQTTEPVQAPIQSPQASQTTVPTPTQPAPTATATASSQPEQPPTTPPTEPVQPASNPLAA